MQRPPRGGEEGDGLGALLHEGHGRRWGETGHLKEIKDVATIKIILTSRILNNGDI